MFNKVLSYLIFLLPTTRRQKRICEGRSLQEQLTLQEQLLKRTFTNSNHVSFLGAIRNIWLRHFYQTSNSQIGNQRWSGTKVSTVKELCRPVSPCYFLHLPVTLSCKCCISLLVRPGTSPGIQMCLSAPGIYNIKNILSCRFKQCWRSFLVQLGWSPGIEMCLSTPEIYNTTHILSCRFKQCWRSFLVQLGRSPGIERCLSSPRCINGYWRI